MMKYKVLVGVMTLLLARFFCSPGPYLWAAPEKELTTSSFVLTMQVITSPHINEKNGMVEYKVRWVVDPGVSGYVIQHIKFVNAPKGSCFQDYEFWEAWEVRDGAVWIGNSNRGLGIKGGTDTFQVSVPPRNDSWLIVGEVQFWAGYQIDPYWNGWTPGVRNSCHSNPGPLLFSMTGPEGWDERTSLTHQLEVGWRCGEGSCLIDYRSLP